MIEKSIFISHSSKDTEVALKLAVQIEKKIGKEKIWVDFFDLSSGNELVPVIAQAIGKAKWFILIASEASMNSNWVQHEAKLALFRSIEKKDFQIITLKIDKCEFPSELDIELRSRKYIDAASNLEQALSTIVQLVESEYSTRSISHNVFVDRGRELDDLEQSFGISKLIYLVDWHGIGKTSLIEEFANIRLGAPFIKIELSSGHETELLCRQVIARAKRTQPSRDANDKQLTKYALDALADFYLENNGFLFIDNVENAEDDTGQFRNYLKEFIRAYYDFDQISNPMILSAIQRPEIGFEQTSKSKIVLVKPLPDPFILQCIQRWYFSIKGEKLDDSIELGEVDLPPEFGSPAHYVKIFVCVSKSAILPQISL